MLVDKEPLGQLGLETQPVAAPERLREFVKRQIPRLTKAVLAFLDQGLNSGSNFVVSLLLARWLTSEEYGAYALAYSIFLLLSGFHNALILEPMSVLGPSSYRRRVPEYLGK